MVKNSVPYRNKGYGQYQYPMFVDKISHICWFSASLYKGMINPILLTSSAMLSKMMASLTPLKVAVHRSHSYKAFLIMSNKPMLKDI